MSSSSTKLTALSVRPVVWSSYSLGFRFRVHDLRESLSVWLDSTRLPSRRAASSKEELDGWLTIRLRCLSLFRLSPLRFPQLRAAQYAKEQGYAILLDSDIEWTYVNMAEVSPRSSFGRTGNHIITGGEGDVLEQTGKSLTPTSIVIDR